jgi:hypothetical protein
MFDPTDNQFFDAPPPQQQRGPRPHLRFWTETIPHPGKSAEEGRAVYFDVDMIGITNPGSRDETVRKAADKAKEDEYYAWAYAKWQKTKEQPVDGTPVEMVPWLNKSQALELKGINIHTLEVLAEAPEPAMQRMMGLRDLKKKAQSYLAAAKDGAVVSKMQDELADRDRTISMLQKQMADMSARFDDLAKRVSA